MKESMETGMHPERTPEPKVRLIITRHAERLPSGVLSPEGIERARAKGRAAKESGAEVLKAYVNDHKSGRAFDTGNRISEASEITSELSGKQFRTHLVPDIQYEVLKPDLSHIISEAGDMIDEATLAELGMSTERDAKGKLKIDLGKLPMVEQERIAPVRQKNQRLGFIHALQNDAALERMAMGLAHQLTRELDIAERYLEMRKEKKPLTGDVLLNTVSHGMFLESLFKKAGVRVLPDGKREKGVVDFEDPAFGGYIEPGESIALTVEDPQNLPAEIPVEFEREGRPKPGSVFIDTKQLFTLAEQYEEWKKTAGK